MTTSDLVYDSDFLPLDEQNASAYSSACELNEWVYQAALEVRKRIIQRNDGLMPSSVDQWIRCCEQFDISVKGLRRGTTFTALLVGTRGGSWWIFYNSMASRCRHSLYIAHELAEYITREQSWHVQPPACCIGTDEDHIRHLIAKRFEEMASEFTG